jgi:Rieske Fe-S protein
LPKAAGKVMAEPVSNSDNSRREFLRFSLLLGAGAACAGAGATLLSRGTSAPQSPVPVASLVELEDESGRFAPLAKPGKPFAVEIQLTRRDGWRVRTRPQSVYLQRVKAGSSADCFKALSPVCPHAGCSVTFGEKEFTCPCHKAKFEAGGKRQEGPAPRDLDALALSVANIDGKPWLHVAWQDFAPGLEAQVPRA